MSKVTNTQLMDTAPGGENTQYESPSTFTEGHAKEKGQFNDSNVPETEQQQTNERAEREEKTAENIRYGEAISEHGFGGETVGNDGTAIQEGYGRVEDQSEEGKPPRREQGYGGGSGVGA